MRDVHGEAKVIFFFGPQLAESLKEQMVALLQEVR